MSAAGDALVRAHIPHAPGMGLYVEPNIPQKKLLGAIGDYAPEVRAEEVIALYDGTLFGSARDGTLFLADRLVSQANDLESPRTLSYAEVVGVSHHRKTLGGRQVDVEVARGRTTVTEVLDFAAHPDAATHVAQLLEAALMAPPPGASDAPRAVGTDPAAVADALDRLVHIGRLTDVDRRRLLAVLDTPKLDA